ncbi:MAG: M15 family metallopeptidase [Prevotella sp.]|nr:M15 family metallopeptidase [Prevotella sp.]
MVLTACAQSPAVVKQQTTARAGQVVKAKQASKPQQTPSKPAQSQQQKTLSKTAQSLAQRGYVNVKDRDESIQVSLMYARPDNFCGKVLYTDLREAYLHPLAADALAKAQRRLKELRPELSLKVYDAARPMSIQQRMWDEVKNTDHSFYVSNPANGGGLHNYGLAVDISICVAATGDTIPMGTKVDHMSSASHIDRETELVAQRRITAEARQNRQLLREVMEYAGYKPLRTEWWHFNLRSRAEAKKNFKVIK